MSDRLKLYPLCYTNNDGNLYVKYYEKPDKESPLTIGLIKLQKEIHYDNTVYWTSESLKEMEKVAYNYYNYGVIPAKNCDNCFYRFICYTDKEYGQGVI
jgi:hypothetical protein